ncbi:hypothetical protein MMC13_004586 [Lambiella insularis]|nr:hypothetical protein [Lambiella insularis]
MSAPSPVGIPPYLLDYPAQPPPPGQKSNFVDPDSLQPAILATGSVMIILTTGFVLARLYSALRITKRVGKEDWSCIIATILSFAYVAFILDLSYAARHMWNVPAWWFSDLYWKLRFAQNTIQPLAFIFSRITFFLLYLRLFGRSPPFRWACYFGIAFYFVSNIIDIPLYAVYCAPAPGNPWASMDTLEKCAQLEWISLFYGGINIASDLYIIILPMPMIWGLQMSLERKLGIMAIFTSGLFVLIASIVSMVYRYKLVNDGDTNWTEGSFVCAVVAELCVAIITSCMPALATITNHHFPNAHFILSIRTSFMRLRSKPTTGASNGSSTNDKVFNRWKGESKASYPSAGPTYSSDSQRHLEDHNYYQLGESPTKSQAVAYTDGPYAEEGKGRGITKKMDVKVQSMDRRS